MGIFLQSNAASSKNYQFQDNFKSPLLQEIKDPYDLKTTYNKFPIVPFFGSNSNSSDVILMLLYRLIESTPIAAACVDSINEFCVGGGIDLKRKAGIFNRSYDEVNDSEIQDFEGQLSEKLYDTDLKFIASHSVKTLKIDGNSFVKITVSKLANKFKIEPIDTNKVRLSKDKTFVVIANSFSSNYVLETPIQIIPTYPNFLDESGVIETVLHLKKASPNRNYYGLSSSASSILSQYQLNQLLFYLSAETDNRFTGRVLFDSELSQKDSDGAESESTKDFLDMIEQVYTTKNNDRRSVMARFREFGTKETSVTKFDAMTGHEFYDVIIRNLNNEILTSFGWDRRLLGGDSSSSLASTEMETVFKLASQKVKSTQSLAEQIINTSISFASEYLDFDFNNQYQVRLVNLYEKSLKMETI